MIDILLITIGLAGLTAATIVDIKKREVPDWVSYSMITAGFGLRLINALATNQWSYLVYGVIGFAAMFAVGMFMYYARQWGGGDTKLVMAMGVIFATVGAEKFFLFDFFINLLVVGAAYGIIFGVALAIKRWEDFREEVSKVMAKERKWRLAALGFGIIAIITMFAAEDKTAKIVMATLAIFLIIYVYLITFMRAVDKACMYKYVEVDKLTEGDWVAEEVKSNNKVICGPKDLGLEKEQIEELKRAKIKKVLVKEGIPFVPPFLIATVLTLATGNLVVSML